MSSRSWPGRAIVVGERSSRVSTGEEVVGRCNDVDGWTRCCRWCVKGDGLGLSDVFVQLCTGFVGRWVDVVCWGLQQLPSWRPCYVSRVSIRCIGRVTITFVRVDSTGPIPGHRAWMRWDRMRCLVTQPEILHPRKNISASRCGSRLESSCGLHTLPRSAVGWTDAGGACSPDPGVPLPRVLRSPARPCW
jgi:hypothetical protein